MRRSLALLQESYPESESDEEENAKSSKDNPKDKPQSKVVSYSIKCKDADEVSHSKNSKSSDHQTSGSRMNIFECFDMNISLDDIPLPSDASPKDMLQPKSMSYSKESADNNEKSSIIGSKSSDHGKHTPDIVIESAPLSLDIFKDKPHTKSTSPEAIDYLAEDVDKMHGLKASKLSPSHQDNPSDSQMPISGVSPLSIDDTLENKLKFELMPFLKGDGNDEKSSSEDFKTPLHEDDSSDSRVTVSEESPLSSDDTSKVKLPYELESMCYEGMDDQTSGSEDSKSYDNQDGSADCKMKDYSLLISVNDGAVIIILHHSNTCKNIFFRVTSNSEMMLPTTSRNNELEFICFWY